MACWDVLSILICIAVLFQSDPVMADCIDVCISGIGGTSGFLSATCGELLSAEDCFYSHTSLCNTSDPWSTVSLALNLLQNHITRKNCRLITPPPMTAAPPTTTPTSFSTICPQSLSQESMSPVALAVVSPSSGVIEGCRDSRTDRQKLLQHCSVFLDGYLRPFPAYRNGLQSCSLPGSWILFRHERIVIEVEGTGHSVRGHVSLMKINVTIFPDDCYGQRTYNYIAQNSSLPNAFSGDHTPHNNTGSALQLHVSENNTVASILMVDVNFTIVIRKVGTMLAITLQVPGLASFYSEGLCSGCPRQQLGNLVTEMNQFSHCPEYFSLLTKCFLLPSLMPLNSINNGSYYDACTLTLARAVSGNAATFFNNVAMDAIILSDDGKAPQRPTTSTQPPSRETSPPPSRHVTTPTTTGLQDYTTSKDVQVVDKYATLPKHGLPEPKEDDKNPVANEQVFHEEAGASLLQSSTWLITILLILMTLTCHTLS